MGLFKRKDIKTPESKRPWFVPVEGPDGRIIKKCTNTTNKQLALEIEVKLRVEIAEGKHLDKKRIHKTTFHELCDKYWNEEGQFKKTKGLPSTIKIFEEGIGNQSVAKISPKMIERFLARRMKYEGVSVATRNRKRTQLSAIFSWGLKEDPPLVADNPITATTLTPLVTPS